jgi:hypothetical protein
MAARRFASANNKHGKMACSTPRSTHAASTRQTRLSSLALSSYCVRWLVSSWNEGHIEQKLISVGDKAKLSLELKQNAEQVAR